MKKIARTDDMIFALYKSWKKHYGMHDSGASKAFSLGSKPSCPGTDVCHSVFP